MNAEQAALIEDAIADFYYAGADPVEVANVIEQYAGRDAAVAFLNQPEIRGPVSRSEWFEEREAQDRELERVAQAVEAAKAERVADEAARREGALRAVINNLADGPEVLPAVFERVAEKLKDAEVTTEAVANEVLEAYQEKRVDLNVDRETAAHSEMAQPFRSTMFKDQWTLMSQTGEDTLDKAAARARSEAALAQASARTEQERLARIRGEVTTSINGPSSEAELTQHEVQRVQGLNERNSPHFGLVKPEKQEGKDKRNMFEDSFNRKTSFNSSSDIAQESARAGREKRDFWNDKERDN